MWNAQAGHSKHLQVLFGRCLHGARGCPQSQRPGNQTWGIHALFITFLWLQHLDIDMDNLYSIYIYIDIDMIFIDIDMDNL